MLIIIMISNHTINNNDNTYYYYYHIYIYIYIHRSTGARYGLTLDACALRADIQAWPSTTKYNKQTYKTDRARKYATNKQH